jgi:hypothetical protein
MNVRKSTKNARRARATQSARRLAEQVSRAAPRTFCVRPFHHVMVYQFLQYDICDVQDERYFCKLWRRFFPVPRWDIHPRPVASPRSRALADTDAVARDVADERKTQ